MSSSPPTSDNEISSPVPVPASPSTSQSSHTESQTLITAGCGHLFNSTTPSFASEPSQSIEPCPVCKLREAVSIAEYFWHRAHNGSPLLGADGSLNFNAWRRARLALANYLFEVDGTDGCIQEGEHPCWIEMARLHATHLHLNVLTDEERKEEARERKLAAQRARVESRAAAFALAAAARNRKKSKPTQVVADDDDEVSFKGQMSTLLVNSTASLSMPTPSGNIDTKPLVSILKKTTKTTTRPQPTLPTSASTPYPSPQLTPLTAVLSAP
jgi:hypothetical protein